MKKINIYFKLCINYIYSIIFNLWPINRNRVMFYSYYGKQYSCNPKYISEYINKNYNKTFEVIWSFENNKYNELIDKGIKIVKYKSIKHYYYLCTAKYIVTNSRTDRTFIKRKNQIYIQTWHSSLRLKNIEKDAENSLSQSYVKNAQKDSAKCDFLISGCKLSTEIYKNAFWYDGKILEFGTPRNDIFFNTYNVESIRKKLKLDKMCNIILYAPTFRKDKEVEVYNLNYRKVLESVKKRFGGEWKIITKLHPLILDKSKELSNNLNIIDATNYDDIQELLYISDIVISDYSSLIFDYIITRKPCFLYTPDIEKYTETDRGLYFNIETLPFDYGRNNEEFCNKIIEFNLEKYNNECEKFIKKMGSFERGQACKKIVDIMIESMKVKI